MLSRLHSFFSPPHPVPRASLYAGSVFIASLGRGLWVPFALIYFHSVVGLPLPLIGLGLTIGGLWGMAFTPLAGILVDRFGPRVLLVVAQLVAGSCMLAFLLVHSFPLFLLVELVLATGLAMEDPAFNALVAELFLEEDRDWWFGFNRSASNLGIGLGGLLAGAAVSLGGTAIYHVLLITNAISTISAGLLLLGLTLPVRHHRPHVQEAHRERQPAGYRAVLRDRPFLGFIIIQAILCLCYMVLEIALPPYVLNNLHAPAWGFSMLYTINTAMVVVLQVPLMHLLMKHRRTRGINLAGLVFAFSFLLFLAALIIPRWLLVPYLVMVMVIYTLGELLLSPSQVSLSMALAPENLRGRYMAISGLTYGLSSTLAPVLFTSLLTLGPAALWLPMTALIAGTACLILVVERHLPASALRALPQEQTIQSAILQENDHEERKSGDLIGSH
jgi:MFS family permease